MKKLAYLAIAAGALAATPAAAAVNVYTISDGIFSDGTTFGGSFEYDESTGDYGDFNIVTHDGILTGTTYTNAESGVYSGGGAGPNNVIFFKDNGLRYLNFSFASALSSAGSQNFAGGTSYECNNCSPYRLITGGSVSAMSAVPEPATWAMMIGGFGMIGGTMRSARRRKDMVAVTYA